MLGLPTEFLFPVVFTAVFVRPFLQQGRIFRAMRKMISE